MITFDLYVPGDSPLHRLDPRVKLLLLVEGLAAAFLIHSPWAMAAGLLALLGLLRLNGIPLHLLTWLWRQMRVLLFFILLLQPFFSPGGEVLLALGPLRWTSGGVEAALYLALRVLLMAYLVAALLFTTEQRRLVQALVRLGMPYEWGLMLSLTLRFIPAIYGLFVTVREAQAARGWRAEGPLLKRWRGYLPVLVAVVIGTLRQSDQLTMALAARGLGRTARRTVWRDLRMRPLDWLALGAGLAGAVALAALRGFG